MLRFKNEFGKEYLIFAFIDQESAHFFDFETETLVREEIQTIESDVTLT